MSSNKVWYGVIGAAIVAVTGIGLYYLAQEEEEKVLKDPTKEKLIEILKEFEIEYASLYIHWHSMLKSKEKEVGKGKISDDILEAAKEQLHKLTENVDEEVMAQYNISRKFFEEWWEKYKKTDPEVKALTDKIEKNFNLWLEIKKPEFDFDYPKELTKDKYIKFIKASYAKFRYDTYHAIQKVLKETGKDKLSDEEFNDVLKKCSLPQIKIDTYRRMKLPEVEGEKPTRTALKAYLMMMEDDEAWHKEILHIQKEHKQILFSIPDGTKLQNMHEDPLDVLDKESEQENNNKSPKKEQKVEKPAVVQQKAESQKKSFGAFSFLGNENDQKKLVEDFLKRNKAQPKEDKKDEAQEEQQDEAKKEENQDNEEPQVEENKENEVNKQNITDSLDIIGDQDVKDAKKHDDLSAASNNINAENEDKAKQDMINPKENNNDSNIEGGEEDNKQKDNIEPDNNNVVERHEEQEADQNAKP